MGAALKEGYRKCRRRKCDFRDMENWRDFPPVIAPCRRNKKHGEALAVSSSSDEMDRKSCINFWVPSPFTLGDPPPPPPPPPVPSVLCMRVGWIELVQNGLSKAPRTRLQSRTFLMFFNPGRREKKQKIDGHNRLFAKGSPRSAYGQLVWALLSVIRFKLSVNSQLMTSETSEKIEKYLLDGYWNDTRFLDEIFFY